MIDTDEELRRLGEFAIGTNYGIREFTKDTLFIFKSSILLSRNPVNLHALHFLYHY
jgi:hypothetical protein